MPNKAAQIICTLKPEDMDWVRAQADALGIPRATYVNMLIRRDRTGVHVPSVGRAIPAPQAIYADEPTEQDGAEAEFDTDAVLARAAAEAENHGAFEPRPELGYDPQFQHGEVRRVGRAIRPQTSGTAGLPPVGRFSVR